MPMRDVVRLLAGVARVPFAMPLGAEMMGYALRQGRAESVLDPLFARAIFLRSDSDVLLVTLDLCLLTPAQACGVRGRLAHRTGIPWQRIVLTCIHTHSGPDTGIGALLAGRPAPAYLESIFSAAVEAGAAAVESAGPARLAVGTVPLAIGRNRRRHDAPIDPMARIVRVDRADGAALAILWLHGCHPTVLGHENLAYSADWPGAASAVLEAAFPGALAIFVLSAHGDVDPRTRGLQDLARSDRSLGAGGEAMRAIGREAGAAIAHAAATLATTSEAAIGAASAQVTVPVHGGADETRAARSLAERKVAALEAVGLAPDTRVRIQELYRLADECAATLPPEEARERVARVRLYLRDRAAPAFAGGRSPSVEVQAFRIGEARWLALPLEPTVRVGLDWASRAGSAHAAVLSIANGWMRYLPHPDDFAETQAHQGYEVLSSTFDPAAAALLLETGEELVSTLNT